MIRKYVLRIYYKISNIFKCSCRKFGKKSIQFYGKSKTPSTLTNVLNLTKENVLSYCNEDMHFFVTVLLPTNATGYVTDNDSGNEDDAGTVCNSPRSVLLTLAVIGNSINRNYEDIEEAAKNSKESKMTSHLGPG